MGMGLLSYEERQMVKKTNPSWTSGRQLHEPSKLSLNNQMNGARKTRRNSVFHESSLPFAAHRAGCGDGRKVPPTRFLR